MVHRSCRSWAPTPTHPYLNWLFHTLVEEVEGTGPLHPEGKGWLGFSHGGTGEQGERVLLRLGREADMRERRGWLLSLGQKFIQGW